MSSRGAFIGQVARDTGLSIHTIRFYEARQLLPQAPRTQSGYRVYSAEDMEQLKFIKGAQELGFSLSEIRELAILRSRSTEACGHVKSLLEEKLESVRVKRRELEKIEKDLKQSLAKCERQLKRSHPGERQPCPVLVRLGREG